MMFSAIVLTKNEEQNLAECLSSISFADEMLVVDSGSTYRTVALAEKHGARVVTHLFTDFASQRNLAMSQAKGDWVLFIDADERVTPELAEEIGKAISGPSCVYAIPFHTYFFGKRLRFGDAFKDVHVRLFPKTLAHWEQPVHEKIVTDLPCRELRNPVLHYTTRDLKHYMTKVERYIPKELDVMKEKGLKPDTFKMFVRPPARFLQLYFLKLGILDGIAGFQYAILSAYYSFEKHWRYWKLRGQAPSCHHDKHSKS